MWEQILNHFWQVKFVKYIKPREEEDNVGWREEVALACVVWENSEEDSCEKELPSGDPRGVRRKLEQDARSICESQWGPWGRTRGRTTGSLECGSGVERQTAVLHWNPGRRRAKEIDNVLIHCLCCDTGSHFIVIGWIRTCGWLQTCGCQSAPASWVLGLEEWIILPPVHHVSYADIHFIFVLYI